MNGLKIITEIQVMFNSWNLLQKRHPLTTVFFLTLFFRQKVTQVADIQYGL